MDKQKETLAGPPGFPFSHVVAYGDLVFVSGTVGRDLDSGEIVPADIAVQTKQTLENLRGKLEAVGSSLDQVLKVTVFLVDIEFFDEMNRVYRTYFPGEPPARSCVEVMALPDDEALVEIEVIAAR